MAVYLKQQLECTQLITEYFVFSKEKIEFILLVCFVSINIEPLKSSV